MKLKAFILSSFVIGSAFGAPLDSFKGAQFSIDKNSYKFTTTGEGVLIKDMALDPNLLLAYHYAYTIWCEARGDGLAGMLMVSDIIVNRVKSNLFPNNVYDVIHQKNSKKAEHGQFSCWTGKHAIEADKSHRNIKWNSQNRKAFQLAWKIALDRLNGKYKFPRMTIGLFYHTKKINPYWAKKYEYLGNIGSHKVYFSKKL